jgi:hypothetical protein
MVRAGECSKAAESQHPPHLLIIEPTFFNAINVAAVAAMKPLHDLIQVQLTGATNNGGRESRLKQRYRSTP